MKMQSLWLENQTLSMREVPRPAKAGEALIKVRLSGVCGTDLELVRGYYPFTGIPGHEFVGDVVESDDKAWIGKRVVGEINVACGTCEQCQHARPTHCDNRTVLGITNRNGVHAEYTSLPLKNLHMVPDSVTDEAAVFTEPLAAALEIQEQVHFQPSDRVLLIGAGRLGQLIAQTLSLTSAKFAVIAKHPYQQKLLENRKIKLIREDDIKARGWDVVIEATGSSAGFDLAKQALRPRGTLVLKSTYQGESTVKWSPFVVDEITIIGSRCGPFEPALDLLGRGLVDPTILISKNYPLSKAIEAMDAANQPGIVKVLIRP